MKRLYRLHTIVCYVLGIIVASCGCKCGGQSENSSTKAENSTTLQEKLNAGKIDIIKLDILDKLGMERTPDIGMNQSIAETERIVQMYRASVEMMRGKTRDVLEEEQAKQFYSFTQIYKNDKVPRKFKTRNKGLHLFVNLDIPQPSDHRKVVTATEANLRLFKNQVKKSTLNPSDRIDGTIRLSVYQVIRKKGSSRSFRKRLVDSRTIDIDNPGSWEQFNVLSAVQTWIQDPPLNLGLVIIADGGYSLQKVVNFTVKRVDRMNSSDANAPSLSVLVRESLSPSRQHRSTDDAQDCEEGSHGKLCCRHKLWISFKDIGWDSWILAPEGYQAYFCDGSCPRQYKMAHQFSGIKSLVNSLDPSAIPGPCCSPTKMSSLPIAHYNRDGHAVVSVFENMIVDECKCA